MQKRAVKPPSNRVNLAPDGEAGLGLSHRSSKTSKQTLGGSANSASKDGALIMDPNIELENQGYYHGLLPRDDIVMLLANNGDFIVRLTQKPGEEAQQVLSVFWFGPRHFIIKKEPNGFFKLEGQSFPSIQALVAYHYKTGTPVTTKTKAVLKTPVLLQKWELKNDDIVCEKMLGKGNFGEVFKGYLKREKNKPVAIKTFYINVQNQDNMSPIDMERKVYEEKMKFLHECRLMRRYSHPNVVRMIGISIQRNPIMLVMELVTGGSLDKYLQDNGPKGTITVKERVRFCLDAASGMEYLEGKKCIHRDLAARNCLLGKRNTVKIADFGMSKQGTEYFVEDTKKQQVPVKWTAPEALFNAKYSGKSDVWSFGILIWEIYANATFPWPEYTNRELALALRQPPGVKPKAPGPEMPYQMEDIMLKCCEYDADSRPTFMQVRQLVKDFYQTVR